MWRRCDGVWLLALTLLHICSPGLRADEIKSPGNATGEAIGSNSIEGTGLNTPPQSPFSIWSSDWRTRSKLSGDWWGVRTELGDQGLTFYGNITQYYQGVAAGGFEQQFKYGGRADYLADLDSRKMGLWTGGHLSFRGESRLGQDANVIDGVVAPSNFALAIPRSNQDVTALTGVQYTQDLSDHFSIFFGKLNLLDGTPVSYSRGMRLTNFWNSAAQNDLSRVYLLPSVLGTGLVIRDEIEPIFTFYLLDTHYIPTTNGFPTLFSNGVLLYSEYRARTNWFGLPGHITGGLLYSSAKRAILDLNPFLQIQAKQLGVVPEDKTSTWTVSYRFDQVLYADPDNPKRNVTLNGAAGLTDGDPNPIKWFAHMSVVGNSPIPGRNSDTFGIGYYHIGITSLPIVKTLGFGAEDGVELFYNAAITPWFHVTPDLQVIDPSQRKNRTSILVGIRGGLSF